MASTDTIVEYVSRIVQKIFDYVSNKMDYESFSLMSSSVPKVDTWVSDTRQFIQRYHANKMVHDIHAYDAVRDLEDRAYELLSTFRRDKGAASVGAIIRPLANELSKIRAVMQQEGVGQHKMRQPPLMISFAGASQIGKSRLLRPFVAALLGIVTDPIRFEEIKRDFDSHVYSRQPEHEFWDGYHGQMVCFLDEKDLVKESLLVAGNASTDIIRMGNIFPNVLHMAGIEQKGNVYFRSKIVLCTSNVENSMEGAQQSVRFPEAVTNRFHFEIVVRVAREFALEEDLSLPQEHWRLDHSKLPLSGEFEPRVHEYIILKRVRDVSRPNEVILEKSRVLNFEELLIECAKKFRELERIAGKVLTDDVRSFEYGSKIRNKVMKAQMDEDQTPFFDAYDKPLSEGNFAEFNILIDALDSVKDPEMAYRAYYSLKEDERNVYGFGRFKRSEGRWGAFLEV